MDQIEQLKRDRDAACRRYAAAAREYVAAWTELHALDSVETIRDGACHGFGGLPVVLGHTDALPDPAKVLRDPAGRAAELRDRHLASLRRR